MRLSTSERKRSYDANHPECKNRCGTQVYWRDGAYCTYCAALPERWCFGCSMVSHTAGSACLYCDKAYGRLTFGFDRLSDTPAWGRKSENQRIGGWTDKTPHPDAVWHETEPMAWRSGEQVVTDWPVFKAKAPGIGWKADPRPMSGIGAPPTGWMRKSLSEVNWYLCGACGQPFGPGDGGKTRTMVNATLDWYYSYNGPKAHQSCPLTQREQGAVDAAMLAANLSARAHRADIEAGRHNGEKEASNKYRSWADPVHGVVEKAEAA